MYKLFVGLLFFLNLVYGQNSILEYSFQDMLGKTSSSYLFVKGDEAVFTINDGDKDFKAKTNTGETKLSNIALEDQSKNRNYIATFSYSTENKIFVRLPYTKGKEKEFIYKFSADKLNWQITKETQQIGPYFCRKATVQLHGRYYEAWFTEELPIKFGPFRLNGLSGMITEVNIFLDKHNTPICKWKLVSVSNKSKDEIFNFCKEFFIQNEVMDYFLYEKTVSEVILNSKRTELNELEERSAKLLKQKGVGWNIKATFDKDYFTKYLYDLPKGIREKLDELN